MIIRTMGAGRTAPYAIENTSKAMLFAVPGRAAVEENETMTAQATEIDEAVESAEKILLIGEGENIISISLNERQKDVETTIDIYIDAKGNYAEGFGDLYAANIIIPPKKYRYIETEERDENDRLVIKQETEPLDSDAVQLILWPLPKMRAEIENDN